MYYILHNTDGAFLVKSIAKAKSIMRENEKVFLHVHPSEDPDCKGVWVFKEKGESTTFYLWSSGWSDIAGRLVKVNKDCGYGLEMIVIKKFLKYVVGSMYVLRNYDGVFLVRNKSHAKQIMRGHCSTIQVMIEPIKITGPCYEWVYADGERSELEIYEDVRKNHNDISAQLFFLDENLDVNDLVKSDNMFESRITGIKITDLIKYL